MEPEPILPSPTELQPVGNLEAADSSNESSPGVAREAVSMPKLANQPQSTPQSASLQVASQTVSDPVSQQQSAPQDSTTPAIADDVDVIEKEWVDKAKKIVSSTKDDPYSQERQVSKLQADYLMKRYGKQIKTVD